MPPVREKRGQYPFAELWYETGTAEKWKFTTYERDCESINDYAMARYYVNRFGRFSSPDPIAGSIGDPRSLNRYAYVRNDPVNLTDPTGLVLYEKEPAYRGPRYSLFGPFDIFRLLDISYERSYDFIIGPEAIAAGQIDVTITYVPNLDNLSIGLWVISHRALPEPLPPEPTEIKRRDPDRWPVKCNSLDLILGSLEFIPKVGLEIKVGSLVHVGGSFFKNVTTGEAGAGGGISLLGIGFELSRTNPPRAAFNSDASSPEVSLKLGPYNRNLMTGQKDFSWSKMLLRIGGALGLGLEVAFNPDTYAALASRCDIIE